MVNLSYTSTKTSLSRILSSDLGACSLELPSMSFKVSLIIHFRLTQHNDYGQERRIARKRQPKNGIQITSLIAVFDFLNSCFVASAMFRSSPQQIIRPKPGIDTRWDWGTPARFGH